MYSFISFNISIACHFDCSSVDSLEIKLNYFFTQNRLGLNGKIFKMAKFRTMLDKNDTNGILLLDDQSMTTFGVFLRSASLDELPGLWNVLKSDMSLVRNRNSNMMFGMLTIGH